MNTIPAPYVDSARLIGITTGSGVFFRLQVSRAGIFCDLSTGEFCPFRIPVLGKKLPEDLAAASRMDTSEKYEALPPVTKKDTRSCDLIAAHWRAMFQPDESK
jgi:hypothetical protein